MKQLLAIVAILAICLVACKKEISDEQNPNSDFGAKARMSVSSGVLSFSTEKEMYDSIKVLRNMSITQRKAWESGRSFTSMITTFDTIMAEENAIADYMETLPVDSYPNYANKHTPLIATYPNVIKEVTMYDSTFSVEGKYYDLNIYNQSLAYVANKDGLVIFGGKTYCYTKDKIKFMNSTNSSYFTTLINATVSTNAGGVSPVSITVISTPIAPTPIEPTCVANKNQWNQYKTKNGGPNNRFRTITYFSQTQTPGFASNQMTTFYKIEVTCLVKRVFGLWYDGRKPKNAYGSWNLVGNSVSHYFTSGGTLTSESLSLNESETGIPFIYSNGRIDYEIPFSTISLPDQVRFINTANCEDPELQSVYSSVTSSIVFNKNNTDYTITETVYK
jgi:hypothetical protein